MGIAIPEASREILRQWHRQGLIFIHAGDRESRPGLGFSEDVNRYYIPEQPIPEGLTVGQVRGVWEQGLKIEVLNSTGWELITSFYTSGTFDPPEGNKILAKLRIPAQPIPEKLLYEPATELPMEDCVVGAEPKWRASKPTAFTSSLEADPNGLDPHAPGAKLDAGKNRLGLVLGGFARALEEVGKVGTYGANKYSDNGWKKVEKGAARYDDAMLRHWIKRAAGEAIDPETGLLHQAQVVWSALAVLEAMLEEFDG